MNPSRIATTVAIVAAMLVLFIPVSASAYTSAPLTFCNQMSINVSVTTGYHSPGVGDPADNSILTGPFVTTGWYQFAPGECAALANPFNARYMFWFGMNNQFMNSQRAQTIVRDQNLPDSFCVPNYFNIANVPSFTFEDENKSPAACGDTDGAPQGHNLWVHPRTVDTWVNATVNFTGQ
jgi:uncharacterized membrane protein